MKIKKEAQYLIDTVKNATSEDLTRNNEFLKKNLMIQANRVLIMAEALEEMANWKGNHDPSHIARECLKKVEEVK